MPVQERMKQNLGKMVKKRQDKRYLWIGLGVASLLIRWLLTLQPVWAENGYSRGLFRMVRWGFDLVVGWIPFPLIYAIVLLVPCWGIWKLVKSVRQAKGFGSKIGEVVLSLLAFGGALITLFLWLWGYNYDRIPIEDHLGLTPLPLSQTELRQELEKYTSRITQSREALDTSESLDFSSETGCKRIEKEVSATVVNTMLQWGYPASNNLPVRTLLKGTLLRIGTAGFYLPFTGECNLDGGLHPLQVPYVMAHEMAHGQGIGDEGSCNFIAFLSCINSEDPYVRYSGYLSFWRTLAANYRVYQPEKYAAFRKTLPSGIIADLDAINANNRKYPDFFPSLRDATYNAYLHAQGIEEGMQNYDRVVVLVRAYFLN